MALPKNNYKDMNKEELLQELSLKVNSGEISRSELLASVNIDAATSTSSSPVKHHSTFSVTKMLYALGAAIVVVGIIIFFYQVWDDVGSFMRILVTLGLGLIITAIGSYLMKSKPENNIGSVFHGIGGLIIPGGVLVTLSELNFLDNAVWPVAITFCILAVFYYLLNSVHKSVGLTFFTGLHSTIFVYLFVAAITDGSTFYNLGDIYAYLTMAIGISYLLLAQAFRVGWNKNLVSILCFFGALAFLGAAFSRVFDSGLWQMFYFVILIGGFYLSIYMRSREILALSAMFLIIHLSYITGKYFADSLGWPISLVILGFVFIGLGYASIAINKKYITN
jgi:hypothetical protein